MLCFELNDKHKLVKGIAHEDFYSPQFNDRIKEASIRVIAGGEYNLEHLADAIRNNLDFALLCCLVEVIPVTGNNKSSVFPPDTCLLSIDIGDMAESPDDKSILFSSEGHRRLYGCRPGMTAIHTNYGKVIVHNGKTLELSEVDPLKPEKRPAYEQYNGQNISVLELL